jgi:hypothetical protein
MADQNSPGWIPLPRSTFGKAVDTLTAAEAALSDRIRDLEAAMADGAPAVLVLRLQQEVKALSSACDAEWHHATAVHAQVWRQHADTLRGRIDMKPLLRWRAALIAAGASAGVFERFLLEHLSRPPTRAEIDSGPIPAAAPERPRVLDRAKRHRRARKP